MALRIQRPADGYDYLYQDGGDNRYFTTFVLLGKHEPEWEQCTNADKEAWEEEHKPEILTDPEPSEQ